MNRTPLRLVMGLSIALIGLYAEPQAQGEEKAVEVLVNPNQVVVQVYGIV